MGNEKRIVFDPFCLDLANEQLWRGSQAIKLRPKAFAVLDHLIGRPGQLVTKDDLLNAVWPGTFVSDAVLKVTIRQIRGALGDDPKTPRFIETAHRRGYRFIGLIGEADTASAADARTADRIVSGSCTLVWVAEFDDTGPPLFAKSYGGTAFPLPTASLTRRRRNFGLANSDARSQTSGHHENPIKTIRICCTSDYCDRRCRQLPRLCGRIAETDRWPQKV